MSNRLSPYNLMMQFAVQIKRVKNGTIGQSKFTRYIESIEKKSRDELRQLQAVEISKMLRHAVLNIPYYNNLDGKLELSPKTVHDDIKHFPVVTKEILGGSKELFVDPKIPVIKSMFSGGTTMTRVSVDTDKYSETHRGNEYFNRMVGIYPGMRRFLFTRHESTYIEGGPKYYEVNYKTNKISRTYHVTPWGFNQEKLFKAYELLIKAKPEILKGSSAMLVEFAESIEKNGWVAPEIPIAVGSENTMQPEYIDTLKRIFNSKVHNVYGATEAGVVAVQCNEQDGLHYIPVVHHLETLKDGCQTEPGVTGELVITSLIHYAMPIIRFQIGDYATPTDKMCNCGRTFPMLESIDGRLYETLNTPIGTVVSVHEIKSVITNLESVIDFQIIQKSKDSILLTLKCRKDKLDVSEERYIESELLNLFESHVNIEIDYVREIVKLPSGKILRIISSERYEKAKAGIF